MIKFLFALILSVCFITPLTAEVIARDGKGYLEIDHQQLILHLKGSPYEMGYQHGRLLREKIAQNIAQFIDNKLLMSLPEINQRFQDFRNAIPQITQYIPDHLIKEMQGMADGSQIPYEKIFLLNLFPEMFHCVGLTVSDKATQDHLLYHVRVLDYGVGKGLQDTSVLIVVQPNDGIPFLNISYAGFIGSISGMNNQKISLGEIGGFGYGIWDGIPMAFLLREILQKAHSMDEAVLILENAARTCEYYYVIADGNIGKSYGFYATASQLQKIEPGSSYALLAPAELPKNYENDGKNDKFFLNSFVLDQSDYQTAVYKDAVNVKYPVALFHRQLPDTIIMTGFANPKRYPILVGRLQTKYGMLTVEDLQDVIKSPVTCQTNLHNAIFLPSKMQVWVSHASSKGEAASDQPYQQYDLQNLLSE